MLSNYLICSGVGGGGLAVIYNFEICFIGAGQGSELHMSPTLKAAEVLSSCMRIHITFSKPS